MNETSGETGRWVVLRDRLQERLEMARGVLDETGYEDVAALVPIEEVLIWMDEVEDLLPPTPVALDLPSAEVLARIQWDAEDHVHRGVRKQFDDMPDTVRTHRLRWAERVLVVLSGGPARSNEETQ